MMLLTLTAGCGELPSDPEEAASTATGVDGKADTIQPIGSETLGAVYVDDALLSEAHLHSLQLRGTRLLNIEAGTNARTVAGQYCLFVFSAPFRWTQLCDLDVVDRQVTTVELGALEVWWDTGPIEVDFGPTPEPSVRQYYPSPHGDLGFSVPVEPHVAQVVVPGRYNIDWGLPGVRQRRTTVNPGEVRRRDITPPDARATVEFQFQRNPRLGTDIDGKPIMPAANCADRVQLVTRDSEGVAHVDGLNPTSVEFASQSTSWRTGSRSFVDVANGDAYRVIPQSLAANDLQYEVVVRQQRKVLDLQPGSTETIKVRYVTVMNPVITRDDGTQYTVRGRYHAWRQDEAGQWRLIRFPEQCDSIQRFEDPDYPTNTFFAALEGHFKVAVTFDDPDVGTRTETYFVDLP